jgi:hypothetical protein
MSSFAGLQWLDLPKGKDNVEVPKGIHTPMCFYSDKYKLVRCKFLGYAYGMRFFMCANYHYNECAD